MKKEVIQQVIYICKMNKIEISKDFILYVYNKKLNCFSGKQLKKLKEEYIK